MVLELDVTEPTFPFHNLTPFLALVLLIALIVTLELVGVNRQFRKVAGYEVALRWYK